MTVSELLCEKNRAIDLTNPGSLETRDCGNMSAKVIQHFTKWNVQWAVLKACSVLSKTDECEFGNVLLDDYCM